MKFKIRANLFIAFILVSFFSFSSSANAITGDVPQPILGTATGFYAGENYPALVGYASTTWALQPAEVIKISSILIYEVQIAGAPCGPAVSSSTLLDSYVKRHSDSTNRADINMAFTFDLPEDSANKSVCAITQLTTSSGVYESARTYATIAVNPNATATPEAVAASEPTGTKPTFADSPKETVKQKVKIKAWSMNGSEFKSRKVTLYLCEKDDCSDKASDNSIVYEGLAFDDAKTITMSSAIAKGTKYVVAIDTITFGNDEVVELSTNVRSVAVASTAQQGDAEPEPTESQEIESTQSSAEPVETIQSEESADPEVLTPESEERNSNALIAALVVVIGGLLGVVFWLMRSKRGPA